ncbi:MAG TPA: hypothetical protein VF937_16460, partial [Chloroflexota bacterium]
PWTAYTSSLVLWLTLAAVAIGVVAAGLRRPDLLRAARIADRQLRTASRLATAAEVLEGRLSGSLAPAQLDDTWRLARGIRPLDAYPQGWPRVRMAALGVLVSLTVVALSLVGALAPLEVAGLFGAGDQSAAQTADMDAAQAADAAAADAQALAADQSSNPAASAQTLEELQSQAEQSQAAQAALQKLGDALRTTSAARDIGDALRAGNYDDAAARVETLAQQSDQLSRISKRELANALERAAIDSSKLDPPLAVAEDRVARALNRLVYSETKSSLDNLASAINDAKKGVISQEALAQQLDQLQQQQQNGQKPTGGGGGDIGESEQGYIPDIPGEQPKQVGLVQGLSSTISVPGPEGDPTKAKNSSVGQEAGGDPLGDLTSRLEAPPVDVSVSTQLANDQGRNRANPQAPTVKISDTSQNGVRSSDTVQPGDPVQDVAEQMVEPTESRQAVRAFFKSTSDTASNPAP